MTSRGGIVPAGMPPGTPPVPDAPPIAGLAFRGLVRPDDLGPVVALANLAAEADGVQEHETPEEWANSLEHDSRRDPDRDVLLAEVDGALAGFTIGGWEVDNDGGRNYGVWGAVHPDWRRRGLGGALLRWTEARQRQLGATHDPAVDKRFESWSFTQETSRNALLDANGYAPIRYWFQMDRPSLEDLPQPILPDGVAFRPVRDEDLQQIFEVEVEAFSDHFGGIDDTPEAFARMVNDPRRNSALWVVAWHGDEIVGQSLNRVNRAENEALGLRRGWVNAVGVRRAWRRKGIGRALVAESLRVLRDAGAESARLGVDAENPHGALGLYEGLGFGVVQQGRIFRKPLIA
jgi:mycothiol synthase